jgi:pimeloyl-ACP methyl ester carboxylesterase
MRYIKGLKDLVFDAIEETTQLVERTHTAVADKTARHAKRVAPAAAVHTVSTAHNLVASGVYTAIRTVQRGVRHVTDAGLALAEQRVGSDTALLPTPNTPLRSDAVGSRDWWLDHAHSALNCVIGDTLDRRGNPLAMPLGLRHQGQPLPLTRDHLVSALPQPSRKVCLFVHGLGCTEWAWSLQAEAFHGDPNHNFGTLLARDLGYTPLYLRYNTGRHVSENGRELATLLAELVAVYPEPLSELVLIGHSMGGLVVRSAAHYGSLNQQPWLACLKQVICIGSPHLGAPLEQVGNVLSAGLRAFDTASTQVTAQVLNIRSAGIKDLRFGYVVDEDWQGHDPDALLDNHRTIVPPVAGVGYAFIAATITRDPEHPLGQLVGDLLVHPPSASGRAAHPDHVVPFHSGRVFSGMNHFHIANHPAVYEQIKRLLGGSEMA